MSGPDDYPVEMCDRALDERTIEALLAGRTVPGDDGVLAEFAQSVRAFAHRPAPAPRGELVALLASGLTIDNGDRLVTAASNVTRPWRVSRPPTWRRPGLIASGVLPALMAKFTALGLAAKTGLAVAVTIAGVTAAGATGTLPGQAQNAVAGVVNAVTPLSFPTQASSHAAVGAQASTAAATNHPVGGASGSSAAKQGPPGRTTTTTRTTTGTATTNPGAPSGAGSQSAAGPSRANATPATDHAPASVPTPTHPTSKSGSTPARHSGGTHASQSGGTHGSQSGGNHGSQSGGTHGSQSGGTHGSKSGNTPGSKSGNAYGSQSGGTHGSKSGRTPGSRSGNAYGGTSRP